MSQRVVTTKQLRLVGTSTHDQAKRLGTLRLREEIAKRTKFKFKMSLKDSLKLCPGDVRRIDSAIILGDVNKQLTKGAQYVRIEKITETDKFTAEIECYKHDNNFYDNIVAGAAAAVLWGHWRFDEEIDGNNSRMDSSGNGHNFSPIVGVWTPSIYYYLSGLGVGIAEDNEFGWDGFEWQLRKNGTDLVTGTDWVYMLGDGAAFNQTDYLSYPWEFSDEPDRTSIYYEICWRYHHKDTGWRDWNVLPDPPFPDPPSTPIHSIIPWYKDDTAIPKWKQIKVQPPATLPSLWPNAIPDPGFKEFYSVTWETFSINVGTEEDPFWSIGADLRFSTYPIGMPNILFPGYNTGICNNAIALYEANMGLTQSENFDITGSGIDKFTYTFWCKLAGDGFKIESNCTIKFLESGGKYKIWVNAGDLTIQSNYIFDPGIWYYVVVYYDGSGLHADINDVPVTSVMGPHNIAGKAAEFVVEALTVEPDTPVPVLLDDFKVYTGSLTAAERTYWYNGGSGRCPGAPYGTMQAHADAEMQEFDGALSRLYIPGTAADLMDDIWGDWDLDETSGNRVDSISANNGVPNAYGVGYDTGKISNAVHFTYDTATLGSLTMSTPPPFAGNIPFSISYWFKVSASNMVNFRYAQVFYASYVYISTSKMSSAFDNKVAIEVYTGNAYVYTDGYDLDTWYMCTLTYDGTTLKLYINTTLADSDTNTTDCSDDAFAVGKDGSYNDSESWMDALRIWTRALTTDDIAELWNSGSGM